MNIKDVKKGLQFAIEKKLCASEMRVLLAISEGCPTSNAVASHLEVSNEYVNRMLMRLKLKNLVVAESENGSQTQFLTLNTEKW